MANCSQCGDKVTPQLMPMHLEDICEQRLLFCPYCEMNVEARHLEIHMEGCDQRPASCTHCNTEFDSFIALRDTHMDVCPDKPDRRSCEENGRNVQMPDRKLEETLYLDSHVSQSMGHILELKAKVQELTQDNAALKQKMRNLEDSQASIRKVAEALLARHASQPMDEMCLKLEAKIQEFKNENAILKQRVHDLEDCQKREEYVRANLADAVEELREQMSESKATALQEQQDVDATIKELQNKSATLEELLRSFLNEKNWK